RLDRNCTPSGRPVPGALDDLLEPQRAGRVMAQAQWRLQAAEPERLAGDVELPTLELRDVPHRAALRPGHVVRGVDLRRAVQPAEELRGGVPGDLVVQPLRRLGGEQQAQAVLAC